MIKVFLVHTPHRMLTSLFCFQTSLALNMAEAEVPTEKQLQKWKVPELKSKLTELGLPPSGKKASLVERLVGFYQEQDQQGLEKEESSKIKKKEPSSREREKKESSTSKEEDSFKPAPEVKVSSTREDQEEVQSENKIDII